MIKNLTIDNFGSYQNFSGLQEGNEFTKLNLLYGANYSGKTTLSKIIRVLETKILPEKYDLPKFNLKFEDENLNENSILTQEKKALVFNKDFIHENLSFLVTNNVTIGNIKSFDALIIGRDLINIENSINKANVSLNIQNKIHENLKLIETKIYIDQEKLNENKRNLEKHKNTLLSQKATELSNKGLTENTRGYNRNYLESDIINIISENVIIERKYNDNELNKKEIDMKMGQKPFINIQNKKEKIEETVKQNKEKIIKKINIKFDNNEHTSFNNFFQNWILEGYELHKEHKESDCQFCGNEISLEIFKKIEKFINNKDIIVKKEIQELIDYQQKIIESFEEKLNELKNKEDFFYENYRELYINKEIELKSIQLDLLKYFDEFKNTLQYKKDNLDKKIDLDFSDFDKIFEDYLNVYSEICELCLKNDNFSKNIDIRKSQIKKEILHEKIIDFILSSNFIDISKKIKCYDEEILGFNNVFEKNIDDIKNCCINIINLKEIIGNLVGCKSSKLAATGLINKFLNGFFGHETLLLVPFGSDSIDSFKILRNGIDAYNLSEGECTLVAFCYFISKIFNLKQEGKLQDYIIYIDDPISSLDSNNIFYIFSLIDNIICKDQVYKQLFISTHNLEFFKLLKKLTVPMKKVKSCNHESCQSSKRKNQGDIRYLYINKVDQCSSLDEIPFYLKNYTTEFNYLFAQIWNCAKNSQEESQEKIYNIGNNMRKFMETYFYFKYPSSHNKNYYRDKFFTTSNGQNYTSLFDRIAHEYSHTEDFFDRVMYPITNVEIKKAAEFIIMRIEEIDKDQYDGLLDSTKDIRI